MAFVDVLVREGGLSAGKSIMKLIGLDCGPVRLPLRALSTADETRLREGLAAVGFFEFCSKVAG
jgi:N-acetylneuraminate lyase